MPSPVVNDRVSRWQLWIDRGGTFADVGGRTTDGAAVRMVTLDKDLIEKRVGGVATIMTDEFFNVYDKTGPGMSHY